MTVTFNPFTGNLDFVGAGAAVPDPLTVDNLTVNQLLTANHIHGNIAGSVYIHVKNLDDDPLEKGAPFYISGTVGASDRVEVKRARGDDPARGPAIGLIEDTLAVNGEGNGVLIGEIFNYDTDTPDWTTNQPLYVSATGTLTNVKPTTGYRQIVGYVGRVHASTGTIIANINSKEIDTNLNYTASTRLLESSTGTDVTLPEATPSLAGLQSAADKTKLNGIASGAEVNVNADWNASSGDAQILNKPTLGGAAALNVGTTTGTVAAGDDTRITGALSAATAASTYQPLDSDLTSIAALDTASYGRSLLALADAAAGRTTLGLGTAATTDATAYATATQAAALAARLDAFRDARTFYVSKRITASDSNDGRSPGEPFLTVSAAVVAANAYRAANPSEFATIEIGPGTYVEEALPMRLAPKILVRSLKQRTVRLKPAAGQELNSFFAVDSGDMICDITFAGHQAQNTSDTDSTVGTRAWAIQFNEQANGGQGVFLTASPYIKDCLSLTAEDDAGEAGSTSTGDCGGGVEVDGAKCHPNSPIRSMVIYGFTQQNLGGPGAIIKNDGYAELVSFFGLFGTWHVQCESGGQATMSGGGCSEFGIYGLVADGYSPSALFTGSLRVAALAAATTIDVTSLSSNRLGASNRPAAGQLMLLGGEVYVVQASTPIDASGQVVAESSPIKAGYRVTFYSPDGVGLAANVAQGVTADFRLRSQISAGCHSCNFVGSGTNYSALPWNGGIPNRANEIVERNYGRVFGAIINDVGDFKIANGVFAIDGTTGAVTINTDQFNLSGLNAIGPFSRNGGISTVGVQLQEVSNDANLLASTGSSDGNTAPTQFAVRSYADSRFLAGITATAGQPLSVTDTSAQDGNGFWTRSRNITLSLNTANGLARLDGSGLIPSTLLPSYVDDVIEAANLAAFPVTGETGKIYVALDTNKAYRWSGSAYIEISASPGTTDAVPEGSVNLYFSQARARQAISATGSLIYDPGTGIISYTAPSLATVATTGAYSDLSGRPTLGTAAATDATAYATAAQGALADTAVQPAALSGYQPVDSDLTAIAELSSTGLVNLTGSGTASTLTAPTGALVGTTDTQTLTNKTLGTITETVVTLTDAASVDLNPSNGAIQTWTLGASRTATANNFPAGASMLLCVDDGTARTLTWPTITWVGSTTAPTLATTGFTFVQLWKIGTTLYGMAQK